MNIKKIFLTSLLASILFAGPVSVYASVLPYFGGFDVAMIPCTCSGGAAIFWHLFAPLYYSLLPAPTIAGSPLIPLPAGALTALSTPTLFSNYVIHPGIWAEGTQIPGTQACFIGVPPACILLPSIGFITPFTGTSLVPSPPGASAAEGL
jgi:hypothetical protein